MHKFSVDFYSAGSQKMIDAVIAAGSFYLAYQVRFEGNVPAASASQMWLLLPLVTIFQVGACALLGTYRMTWKYIGLGDAIRLAGNVLCCPALLLLMHYATIFSVIFFRVPMGVILMAYFFSLAGTLSARILRRLQYEASAAGAVNKKTASPVLLIGAGRAGVRAANEIRAQAGLRPVAFLDDDPKKSGAVIAGLRVMGPLTSLAAAIEQHAARQVIVCIAPPPREMLRRIWATCEILDIPVKLVPTLEQILEGKATSYRGLDMNDLLGRRPMDFSAAASSLAPAYGGKRILITGAGGSIGSELALQLAKVNPDQLLLLDKDENGLHNTYLHVQGTKAIPLIADIRFPERLRTIFAAHRPEVVFHAAAHKHVHLMEANPCEAITNNVTGTRNLVEQALAFKVARFIQVSTDKAVKPSSVMGASKRVCELIVQSQGESGTRFCCVRFGNVLGSHGSVVPIFQEQIRRGGPVTLTHPDAQRFLMTIPEAVCLLLQAGTLADQQEIFVLDMGEPVLIQKLARDVIELSGLSPNRDVKIEVTGLKRGEKISEVLLDVSDESLQPTRLPKIQTITARPLDTTAFISQLHALERAAWQNDAQEVYCRLADLKIGYIYDTPARRWPVGLRSKAASASAGITVTPQPR
jgi:FlaA1/EpsC-like NDP-sugar epimerase